MKNLNAVALQSIRLYTIGGFFLLDQNEVNGNNWLPDQQANLGFCDVIDYGEVKATAFTTLAHSYA